MRSGHDYATPLRHQTGPTLDLSRGVGEMLDECEGCDRIEGAGLGKILGEPMARKSRLRSLTRFCVPFNPEIGFRGNESSQRTVTATDIEDATVQIRPGGGDSCTL